VPFQAEYSAFKDDDDAQDWVGRSTVFAKPSESTSFEKAALYEHATIEVALLNKDM
jgi:hypothetical protein